MTEHYPTSCNEPDCAPCEEYWGPAKPWPGEEGYCPDCHMIVATEKGILVDHRGSWAKFHTLDKCIGSGTYPTEPDSNVIDPWENDERPGPKRRNTHTPGQSYGG